MLCCKVCDVSYHPFCLPQYQWSTNSASALEKEKGSGGSSSGKDKDKEASGKNSNNPYARTYYDGQGLTEHMMHRKMDNARLLSCGDVRPSGAWGIKKLRREKKKYQKQQAELLAADKVLYKKRMAALNLNLNPASTAAQSAGAGSTTEKDSKVSKVSIDKKDNIDENDDDDDNNNNNNKDNNNEKEKEKAVSSSRPDVSRRTSARIEKETLCDDGDDDDDDDDDDDNNNDDVLDLDDLDIMDSDASDSDDDEKKNSNKSESDGHCHSNSHSNTNSNSNIGSGASCGRDSHRNEVNPTDFVCWKCLPCEMCGFNRVAWDVPQHVWKLSDADAPRVDGVNDPPPFRAMCGSCLFRYKKLKEYCPVCYVIYDNDPLAYSFVCGTSAMGPKLATACKEHAAMAANLPPMPLSPLPTSTIEIAAAAASPSSNPKPIPEPFLPGSPSYNWNNFCSAKRAEVKSQNPDAKLGSDVHKILVALWKELSDDEKALYSHDADEDKDKDKDRDTDEEEEENNNSQVSVVSNSASGANANSDQKLVMELDIMSMVQVSCLSVGRTLKTRKC